MRTDRSRVTEVGSPRARGAGWRAWIASLTVVVIAVAPLLGLFHRASVRHAVCEHGDLIEPDHGSAHADDAAGVASSDASERAATVRRASSPALHGHSHCPVGILAKAGTGVFSPASVVVGSLASVVSVLPTREAILPSRTVLSSAPKTSPPSRAVSFLA